MRDGNDIIGNRYGKLVVTKDLGMIDGRHKYLCRCDCGKDHIVQRGHLITGDTKSCGCDKFGHSNRTHGMSKTKIFKVWQGIKRRCTNEHDECYKKYGAKGIKICPEWEHDFLAFYEWAIAHGYEDGLQIDRIDFRGDYCPENCRWVDLYTQANNKSNVKKYEINGISKSLPEWCREYGVPKSLVYGRVHHRGMDILDALTTPRYFGKREK